MVATTGDLLILRRARNGGRWLEGPAAMLAPLEPCCLITASPACRISVAHAFLVLVRVIYCDHSAVEPAQSFRLWYSNGSPSSSGSR
jgi:hypothetical protein